MNNINNSYFEEIESFDIQKSNRIKQNIRKGISHKNLYEVDSLERKDKRHDTTQR